MSDERLIEMIRVHLGRYSEAGMLDVYKLLHQATFGPGHLITNRNSAREWLEQEAGLIVPSAEEALVESVHPDGDIVRIHLRPYFARETNLKPLLDAFVRSAEQIRGDPAIMSERWRLFESQCAPAGEFSGQFDPREVRLFGRTRAGENWPAVHHSPAYQRAYHPAYRVLSRTEAEALCAKIGARYDPV